MGLSGGTFVGGISAEQELYERKDQIFEKNFLYYLYVKELLRKIYPVNNIAEAMNIFVKKNLLKPFCTIISKLIETAFQQFW